MSKAVLIMDMPSSCNKCPLFGSHYSDMTCRANGRSINYPYPKEERQSWCPLKPIPKKKDREVVKENYNGGYSHGIVHGYNACIYELLSEKE